MASTIKKTANALSSESDLLNVYADLKAVCHKFESYLSVSESAQKRILNWAEKREGDAIQDFLRSLYDIETERSAIDRRYNDHFRIFVKLWKGILSEKKELNQKLKELDAVRKAEKSLSQKVSKAEAKEPQHKVEQRMLELEEARKKTAEVSQDAAQKLLEVQQDKHQTLRTGYTGLYGATMSRIKEHVDLLERMRQLVNSFPAVVARNEDGTYVHEEYTGPHQECPIWWQGERLYQQIQEMKSKHEEERRRAAKEYSAKLDEMVDQQKRAAEKFREMHTGEMSSMSAEQQQMMSNLNAAHEAKVANLMQQMEALESDHAEVLAAEAAKFKSLESVLDSTKGKLEHQVSEYHKLDNIYETTLLSMVTRSHKQALDDVSNAAIWSKQSCMNTFLDAAGNCKAVAETLVPILQSGIDGKSELIQGKLAALTTYVTTTLLSAAGASQSSRAENSHELMGSLTFLPDATKELIAGFEVEVDEHAHHKDEGAAPAAAAAAPARPAPPQEKKKPQVRALYKHEGKNQQGFVLIGFEKGDVMTLIKRREDGWSRVRKGESEGWAPTSYLEDFTEPEPEPAADAAVPPQRSLSARSEAGRADLKDPVEAAASFCGIIDAAVEVAKKIQIRDRELAKLSNQVAEQIEEKMTAAQQSIADATKLFQRLLAQSKSTESGRLLEVNTQLLERALLLESGMENVIGASEGLRAALNRTKGTQGESEFNAKHQSWFEALSASVDAVHEGNPMLTEAIRCVLGRKGKHEELQVACRNITATCAHLAAMSKTKAGVDESHEAQQTVVARCHEVMTIGTELQEAARESQDLALASVLMEDFSDLTANQCKRLTMATQVNVLKLEKELEKEREKLGRLRKLNHQGEKYK